MAEVQQENNAKDNVEKQIQPGGSKCFKCHEVLTPEKNSKLLHCLHTFCDACLQTFSKQNKSNAGAEKCSTASSSACGQEQSFKDIAQQPEPEVSSSSTVDDKLCCPECGIVYSEKDVMPNPFMLSPKKNESNMQDGSPSAEKCPVCTSCEDNQKASSFCMECAEWLCDPCVIAHKRVKLTKDHTVSADVKPDEVKEGVSDNKHRQIFCQTHKTETLKLFCLTCETLTCRDCQLNEHKDHKYQYIEQTIEEQKRALMEGVNELKKRLAMNQEMSQKIIDKEANISKQQVDVFYEVRQVADVITNELISWCKKLLNFLQGVCHGRIKDLTFKKNEVATYDKKARNTIEFVESALGSGDDLSVLLAKSFMAKSINSLKDQTINFQNTLLEFNIKYENDAKFLSKHVSKMGFINVNGKSYPQNPNQVQPPTAPPASTSNQSKENIIAELIKKQPPHVQEKYRTLPVEQKRMFVNHLLQYSERMKNKAANQNANQPAPNMNVVNQRQPHYNTDSTAIRDWYSNRAQRPVLERQFPFQTQQQQQLLQQQQMIRTGTFQQQQFRPGGAPMGQWPGNQLQNPQMPQLRSQPPSLIPADKLPSGRFDIDPLNLRGGSIDPVRVKQEPKERDFSSCQFSDHQPTVSVTNPRIQSPSTSTTGIHQSPSHTPSHTPSNTPGHTPSPSHSDGGGTTNLLPGQSTTTPAMPDINIMDTDRNELLLRLTHPSGQKINAYHLHPKHDPNDPSEDYCGVCHNGGDLLCCDRCPKVFHLQCHVPFINSNLSSSDQWTCTMCIPDSELIITSPLPREGENGSGKRKALDGLLDKEIKVCERILLELFCLEISTVFHEPVPKSVPNYHKIIQSPMDLSTVKSKLRRGHFTHYNTVNDFIVDVNLIFKNCFKFNLPTSDVFAVGKSVKNFFESLVKHYLPCFLEFMLQDMNAPLQAVDGNGVDGPSRNKKRKSPAPDSTRENSSPVQFK